MKHTPGPWQVDIEPVDLEHERGGVFVALPDRTCIAVCDVSHRISQEEIEANARLIAAAPEAFEFVEFVTKVSNGAVSSEEIQAMGFKAYAWLAGVAGGEE